MSLCNHVFKTCGIEIDRVDRRFPVKASVQAPEASETPEASVSEDNYINDRLLRLKSEAEYQVSPASWEQFEAAVHEEELTNSIH